jgi:predicted DNA-binding transcriptional regulator YafY
MEKEQSTFEDLPADAAGRAQAIQEAERAGKEMIAFVRPGLRAIAFTSDELEAVAYALEQLDAPSLREADRRALRKVTAAMATGNTR